MSRDKQTGFHISKESVDKLFPKKDIDVLGYESPIQAFIGEMRIEHERTLESETIKAVRAIDVTVDKEELIKALQYDRRQYEEGFHRGYSAGYDRKAFDLAEEIFAEIETKILANTSDVSGWKHRVFAELKKKYTEGE